MATLDRTSRNAIGLNIGRLTKETFIRICIALYCRLSSKKFGFQPNKRGRGEVVYSPNNTFTSIMRDCFLVSGFTDTNCQLYVSTRQVTHFPCVGSSPGRWDIKFLVRGCGGKLKVGGLS